MARVIFHVDINAFFATAEEILNPEYKDKPVVVAHNSRKSVVTTANYLARSFGIKSAMPLQTAKGLCKDLVVAEMHFDFYEQLSQQFIDYLKGYTEWVEQASIDEAYIDVSEIIEQYEKPLDLAVQIRDEIEEFLELPVSIGIGPNKFLAKMASDMQKPKGITVLRIREVQAKLWPLDISEMHGIGKVSTQKLRQININTIRDLAVSDEKSLTSILGVNALVMIQRANGYDIKPIVNTNTIKSVSQSRTLSDPTADYQEIKNLIAFLSKEIEVKLKDEHVLAKGLSLSIREYGDKANVKSFRFENPSQLYQAVFEGAMSLYDQFDTNELIDYVALNCFDLIDEDESIYQFDLFTKTKHDSVEDIIEELNQIFDKDLFVKGSKLLSKGESNEN